MAWFKRENKGIQTPSKEKKDIPVDYIVKDFSRKIPKIILR